MTIRELPTRLSTLLVLAVATALAAVPAASPAARATFTVSNRADGVDANPGDGACRTASGACTLRAAVMEANARSGPDTIKLPAGTFTLALAGAHENAAGTGDVDLTDDLAIRGASAARTILDGAGLDRILHVLAPARLNLSRVTLRGGVASDGERGGGLLADAGTTLVMTDVAVTRNKTAECAHNDTPIGGDDRFCGDGGGVGTFGTASLTRVTFTGNQTISGSGGGIVNEGRLTMRSVLFAGNSARTSAGGLMNGAIVIASNATFVDNHSAGVGGAIAVGALREGFGSLELVNSTLARNSAATFGGGIADGGRFGGAPLTITNVTISGNTAGTAGGGVITDVRSSMALTNDTITGNSAPIGSGITLGPTSGQATVKNTIVTGKAPFAACLTFGPQIVALGSNLSNDMTCPFHAPGDINGKDPKLGPLRMNRPGKVATHGLLRSSPAIDAVVGSSPKTDGRGVRRPQDGNRDRRARCDIGAYELRLR